MRRHTHQRAGLFLGALLALSSTSRDGLAMGVLVGTRTHVEVLDRKLLWLRGESNESFVEAVEIQNPPSRFAWIRALPAKPSQVSRAAPGLFEALKEETRVAPPFREDVKARKFGPSVFSLIFRDEAPTEATEAPEAPIIRTQPYAVETMRYFEGATTTSTVTRRKRLPESFEAWLAEQNLVLSPLQFNALAQSFDAGWILAATSYEGVPTGARLWLGPVRYDFAGARGLYPARQLGPQLTRERRLEFYTIGSEPLLPKGEVEWSERPWTESDPLRADKPRVHYHQSIELGTKLAIEQQLDGTVTEGHHLIAGALSLETPPKQDLPILTAEVGELPTLPGGGRRGSALDLFLVLILGLLPLLYTPESWALLWIAHRTKEARKRDEDAQTWGLLLWPLYSLGVALYFLVTLEDLARTAALLPLAVAAVRLAIPAPDREREFFFRFRPKKAPRKSMAAPRKSMAPGRDGDVRKTGDLRPMQEPANIGGPRPSAAAPRPSRPPASGGPSDPSGKT